MFSVQAPIMQQDNKHTLPPLSHIITAAAIPFGQQAQQPRQPHPEHAFQIAQQEVHSHQHQQHHHQQQQQQQQQQQRSLITPPSSTDSPVEKKDPPSPKYSSKQPTDRCTCKHDGNHIPRPRNAFILFRQQHHQSVLDEGNVIKTNPDVSRELGKRWRDLSPTEKDYWNKLAEEEKKRHAEKYPGYRYIPRRFGNKKGSCPYCRAKTMVKQQQQQETDRLLQEKQQRKAQVLTPKVYHSPEPPKADTRSFTPTLSEEHAIAQSFLNLRNQPAHPYMNATPPQPQQAQVYYQQFPAAYPPHPQQMTQHQQEPRPHMVAPQLPGLNNYQTAAAKRDDLPRIQMPTVSATSSLHSPSSASPTDKAKACSISNFLT